MPLKCKVGDKIKHVNPMSLQISIRTIYYNNGGYLVVEDIERGSVKLVGIPGVYLFDDSRWKIKELCCKPKPFKLR